MKRYRAVPNGVTIIGQLAHTFAASLACRNRAGLGNSDTRRTEHVLDAGLACARIDSGFYPPIPSGSGK